MDLGHAFWLALVQGLTEFLPVSSSAHLILLPALLGWPDQGLAFDVAVHVGTLLAVLAYFRADLGRLAGDWLASFGGRRTTYSRLAWGSVIATLPVALAGYLFDDPIETYLRNPLTIALATIGFGLVLWWTDRTGSQARDEYTLGWRNAALIGLAQVLALIPGTSRSGITVAAGLALGLTRPAAARFSFLLSIPVIVLAGGFKTLGLIESAAPVPWGAIGLGVAVSAVSAWLCIHWFVGFITRFSMTPFVIYRLLLGAALLVLFL